MGTLQAGDLYNGLNPFVGDDFEAECRPPFCTIGCRTPLWAGGGLRGGA